MQKFLFFIKVFLKSIIAVCVCLFIFLFPIVYSFADKNNDVNKHFYTNSQDIVLDMWHIEAFEGGSTARSAYLDKVFKLYQKQNQGVFVSLKTMTIDEYNINIKNQMPDIISFTRDCEGVEKYLSTLPYPKDIDKKLLQGCKKDSAYICYPYMIGRYALVSKNENAKDSLCSQIYQQKKIKVFPLGFAQNVLSQKVLQENNLKYNSNAKVYESQYDCYKGFLSGEITTILASQRDVHRLKNRENLGRIENLYYTYLNGFTDLVQYIGVIESSKSVDIAKDFVQFLIKKESQNLISSCGMFSPFYKIYKDDYMKKWEDSISYTKLESLFE